MKRYGQPIFIWYKRQSFNVRGICYQHVGFNRVLLSGTRLKKSFPKHTRQQRMVLLQSLHQQFTVYEVIHIYRIEIIYRVNTSVKKSWFQWPIAAIFDNLIKMQCITSVVGLQHSCSKRYLKKWKYTMKDRTYIRWENIIHQLYDEWNGHCQNSYQHYLVA